MASMTATASRAANPWLAAVIGGTVTALIVVGYALLFEAELGGWAFAVLALTGVGPVIGYQVATGRLGSDWGTLIGGVLGGIVLGLAQVILFPLFVWLFNRSLSFGKVLLFSLIGLIVGMVVFNVVGNMIGQDPAWYGFGLALTFSMWGGATAAAMAS